MKTSQNIWNSIISALWITKRQYAYGIILCMVFMDILTMQGAIEKSQPSNRLIILLICIFQILPDKEQDPKNTSKYHK